MHIPYIYKYILFWDDDRVCMQANVLVLIVCVNMWCVWRPEYMPDVVWNMNVPEKEREREQDIERGEEKED